MNIYRCLICVAFYLGLPAFAEERYYELTLQEQPVTIAGKTSNAMLINGTLPGPLLRFRVGDTAVIRVNNQLDGDASIHWHGLLLPQDQDGVPYVTFLPITSGQSYTYRFPMTHAGTYWYHSHTNIDEQRGQYGAIVIEPEQEETLQYDHELVVQLSDWTHERPEKVLANLKKSGHWYQWKKDAVVSTWGYLKRGRFFTWLRNRWMRMEGMDVSDVAYDAFLVNGREINHALPDAQPGQRIRLRIINSAASSYFKIENSTGRFSVIAADGIDVQPVEVKSLLMGMAETYDVIVDIPASGALQLNANNVDGSGFAQLNLGLGEAQAARLPEKPDLYAEMHHDHNLSSASGRAEHHHSSHHGHGTSEQLDYRMLKLREPVSYLGPLREVRLELTGNMDTYNWNFNNTPLSAADKIKIRRGERVRFILVNRSMMHHPIHLHGHFFKVISGNGDYDPLKHTVDVPPMATVTIEFSANEYKDWLFHCHNLYHAKTGMGRIVRYDDYAGNPEFNAAKMRSGAMMDTDWYARTDLSVFDNYAEFMWRTSNQNYAIEINAEREDWEENEIEVVGLFRTSQWSEAFIRAEHVDHDGNSETEIHLGWRYDAPFELETAFWLDDEFRFDAEIETELQLTKYLQWELEYETSGEWRTELLFRRSPNWAVGIGKSDTLNWSLGALLTF